jgi:hypothetical protein
MSRAESVPNVTPRFSDPLASVSKTPKKDCPKGFQTPMLPDTPILVPRRTTLVYPRKPTPVTNNLVPFVSEFPRFQTVTRLQEWLRGSIAPTDEFLGV